MLLKEFAEPSQTGVEEKSDVADAEGRDFGNFPVTEVVLKFKANDFALIGWEAIDELMEGVGVFLAVEEDGGLRCNFVGQVFHCGGLQVSDSAAFAVMIMGAIAANREEPRSNVVPCRRFCLPGQAQEGVLHNVARLIQIASAQAEGVLDEWALVTGENGFDPVGGLV